MSATRVVRSLTSLGGCRLLEPLGKGPTGAVFKGCKESTGDTVAVKLIRLGYGGGRIETEPADSEGQLRRFVQDCRATRVLNHPHLVQVLDVGTLTDSLYIVME